MVISVAVRFAGFYGSWPLRNCELVRCSAFLVFRCVGVV